MPARTIEYALVDEIVPATKNPKLHDLDALRASVGRFGVIEPAVLDGRTGRLVSGHGRTETYRLLQEAQEAGIDPPDGVEVGEDGRWRVPLVVGWSSADDAEADAAVVALNRIGEGMWDQQGLADLLDGLSQGPGLEGTGFDLDDLGQLLAGLQPASAEAEKAPPPFGTEQIVEHAFAHYRERGLPYRHLPVHECMYEINRLAQADEDGLVQSGAGGPVADTYHPHRHAVRVGSALSPFDSFESDEQLRHAFRFCLEHMTTGITDTALLQALRFVRGGQAASNFRPGFALWIYRRFGGPGATVLDSSTGFGGRLVGFLASPCARYVGIDPSTETYEGNLRLAADLCPPDKEVELIHAPAEDVKPEQVGEVDLAFTSPPYFAKEHYADEGTQSFVRYPDGEAWREGFLVPMMALQAQALRPGRNAVVNVSDVEIGGSAYPLEEWTREAAQRAGLEFDRQERYPLKRVPGAGDRPDRYEPVLIFRKP